MPRYIFNVVLASFFLVLMTHAVAKKAPAPKVYSLEETLALSLINSHDKAKLGLDQRLAAAKSLLEETGIAQSRVSAKIKKLEGQTAQIEPVKSEAHEARKLLALLSASIDEITARQSKDETQYLINRARQANELILLKVIPLYYRAVAISQVTPSLKRMTLQTQKLLEPYKQSAVTPEQTSPSTQLRDELIQILKGLKLLQANNQQVLLALAQYTGLKPSQFTSLSLPQQTQFKLPTLVTSKPGTTVRDKKVTKNSPTKPINTDNQLAMEKKSLQDYFQLYDNNLSLEKKTASLPLETWLSVTKQVGFDLINFLDQIEREQLLKQKPKPADKQLPVLEAGRYLQKTLSGEAYNQSASLFTASYCYNSSGEEVQRIFKTLLGNSTKEQIEDIKIQKQSVDIRLNTHSAFGQFLVDYYLYRKAHAGTKLTDNLHQQSVALATTALKKIQTISTQWQSVDSFSCYLSPSQLAEQQARHANEIATVTQQRDTAQAKLDQIEADKKAFAEKKRKAEAWKNRQWVMKQNPRHFTLQILSSTKRKVIENYIHTHKLGNPANITKTIEKGKTKYSLHYGIYKDRELAYIGQFKLPDAVLKNNIWIRKISSIQAQVKTSVMQK